MVGLFVAPRSMRAVESIPFLAEDLIASEAPDLH
jgi:hypothetical protein